MASSKPVDDPFAALYLDIVFWVKGGRVEIGENDYSRSFVRVLDGGGLVWEGEPEYSGFHVVFQALDAGTGASRGDHGF